MTHALHLQENKKDSQITIEEEEKARVVQDTVHSENSRSIEPKVYPLDAGESTTPLQTIEPKTVNDLLGTSKSRHVPSNLTRLFQSRKLGLLLCSVNESTMPSTPLQTNELEAAGGFKPEAVEYLQESLVVKN
jgi:hypothetical protein